MNQILNENLNKTLAGKEFSYDFEIKERGLYGIEIAASAKSRQQNLLSLRSFLRDDDLAVKIDNISFPKKSGKKGLFDSEASWNGSELKGLNKTILFLIKLSPGKHQLNFSIEQEPNWSVINRIKDSRWGNTYHQVILQEKQYSCFNKNDSNLLYVQNPLLDKAQKDAWRECYEVAGQVISGELEDPTNGANHYYGDNINPPLWAKGNEAEFKIKIDNLIFYNLKREKTSGKIKISLMLTVFLGIILLAGIIFEKEQTITDKYFFIHPVWNEIAVIYFNQDGECADLKQLTNDGYRKSNLHIFYGKEKFGYFQELHKPGENFDYQDEQARKEYYDNYTALMVMNEDTPPFEVYRGDFHTSDWEWFSNQQVRVYKNCGSGCQSWMLIDVETKEIEEQGATFFKSSEF